MARSRVVGKDDILSDTSSPSCFSGYLRISLLGVACASGAYTTIRAIGKRASPMHSVAFFALYSTVVSGILMRVLGEPFVWPSNLKWVILLLCVGVFGLAAQLLATAGLQREKAGRVSNEKERCVYPKRLLTTPN